MSVLKLQSKRRPAGRTTDRANINRILEEPLQKLKKMVPVLKKTIPDVDKRIDVAIQFYEKSHQDIVHIEELVKGINNSEITKNLQTLHQQRANFLDHFRDLKNFIETATGPDIENLSLVKFAHVDIPLGEYAKARAAIIFKINTHNAPKSSVRESPSKSDYSGKH